LGKALSWKTFVFCEAGALNIGNLVSQVNLAIKKVYKDDQKTIISFDELPQGESEIT